MIAIKEFLSIVRKSPFSIFGLFLVLLFFCMALLGPLLAPSASEGRGNPNVDNIGIAPGRAHLFGTDELGRDVLSRIIFGARPAMLTALAVVGSAALLGTFLGLVAGYRGGWIDNAIMRVCELFLSFPPLLLSLVAVSILGPGLINASVALVISWWPWYARLIRGEARSLQKRPFVEIATAMGISQWKIITRHILKNATTPLIVQVSADLGTVILAAGSLAFIGLGAQPPTADWGLMVAQGRGLVFDQWWIATFPGLAICFIVLGFNLLGDAFRDYFDPRSQR